MKKNDRILAASVIAYSFLFYKQSTGINFLLFNIGIISLLPIKDRSVFKKSNWWLAATGCLFSSISITLYGNALSVFSNIISLALLAGVSVNTQSSVIISVIFSFYSIFLSPLFMIIDYLERKKKSVLTQMNNRFKKITIITISLLITTLFFLMYQGSNLLFNNFSKNITLDFIPWDLIVFSFVGFILLYGIYNHKKINFIAELDENGSDIIKSGNPSTLVAFGKEFTIEDELFSGNFLFLLLNALLLIVNVLDFNFLFIDSKLPVGITYSEFVHQGIQMLIPSIIIAIAITLFYFRGALNFQEKNKFLKLLVYLWIVQNAFILISTAMRNNMYISEYGLTYKRIGVFIFLILSLIGLLTTFLKIIKVKSNFYLYRINGWIFYFVLVISCFINWDMLITHYNLNEARQTEKNYLNTLSETNLPELLLLPNDSIINNTNNTPLNYGNHIEEKIVKPIQRDKRSFDNRLSQRAYNFLSCRSNLKWKSWYYDSYNIYKELLKLNADKNIQKLNLFSLNISSLEPIKELNNINELDLSENNFSNLNDLQYFISLKKLKLNNNNINNLKGIEQLTNLEYLDLSGNTIDDFSSLYTMKNMKELHVSANITDKQIEELKYYLPGATIIKI